MAVKVLVVEDEADVRRLIEIKLKKTGFEVTTAKDGQEGIDKALVEKPDLMVIDVMMPKRDGYSVVAEIREKLGSGAPIMILLTAKGQEADIVKGISSGADDYIIKPFAPRELIARINVALIKSGKNVGMNLSEAD